MFFDIDAKMEGRFTDVREPEYLLCNDLLYADDTMLTSSDARKLQAVLDAVIDEGRRYGLELNWAKTVAMQIHNDGNIYTPTGDPVQLVDQVVYLGGLLTTQVTAKPEVSRRIGEARGIFKALQRCWAHANICRKRKLELYSAIVLPKLLYPGVGGNIDLQIILKLTWPTEQGIVAEKTSWKTTPSRGPKQAPRGELAERVSYHKR